MKKILRVGWILCFLGLFPLRSFSLQVSDNWTMDILNELEITRNEVGGPGGGNSFLYVGNHGLSYEDRIGFFNRLTFDDVFYNADLELRGTSNDQIDTEDFSPKKIYFERNSPVTDFQFGDFFANFSQYSLNQNLKGSLFSLKQNEGNPWDFTVLGGTYKNRWEYMWSDKADELKNTNFYGTRVGRKIGDLQTYFNYVVTDEDRMDNIDPGNMSRSTAEITHNHLWSVDWKFKPVAGLDLSGESAVSRYHSTTNANIDLGKAHQLRGRFRVKSLRTQLEYERVPSDFHTPGGSASSDRERYRMRNNYYFGDNEVFFDYTTYWDNIQDTQTNTTKTKIPEGGVTFRNLLNRKTLSTTLKLREQRRHTSSNSTDDRTDSFNAGLEDRFGVFTPGLEYEYRRVNYRKNPDDGGEITHAGTLRVSSYHRTEVWTFRPNVSLRYEETGDYGQSPSRGLNKDWIWSGGLSGGFKSNLRFNTSYNVSRADNYILNADSRTRVFSCGLDYSIGGSNDNVLGLEYQDRRNSYGEGMNDYDENILKLKWTRRF